jgi:hypothetical protein
MRYSASAEYVAPICRQEKCGWLAAVDDATGGEPVVGCGLLCALLLFFTAAGAAQTAAARATAGEHSGQAGQQAPSQRAASAASRDLEAEITLTNIFSPLFFASI